jgi:signal transduction histidine kinase
VSYLEYNGYVADVLFQLVIFALWTAFLWRVLDGRRFSVPVTCLLALIIALAYNLPILALTEAGSTTRILLYPVGSLAAAFLLFYGKPMRKIFASAVELAGAMLAEGLMVPLLNGTEVSGKIGPWGDPKTLIVGAILIPLVAIVLLLFSIPMTRLRDNLSAKQMIVFAVLPLSQIASFISTETAFTTTGRYDHIAVLFGSMVASVLADIVLYIMMIRTERRVALETENKLLEKQLELQLSHYEALTEQYEQVRTMRHDIYHHLNTINILLHEGNTSEAAEYADQLMPMQQHISKLGSCLNPVVDAFLFSRVRDAREGGIDVTVDVTLPPELGVSNTDLIVLFGNIMDNAVEACTRESEKHIDLHAHMAKGYLIVTETNPSHSKDAEKKRRIPELERGVGFRILSSLAKKYDGSFEHNLADGAYTVTVILKSSPAKEDKKEDK